MLFNSENIHIYIYNILYNIYIYVEAKVYDVNETIPSHLLGHLILLSLRQWRRQDIGHVLCSPCCGCIECSLNGLLMTTGMLRLR